MASLPGASAGQVQSTTPVRGVLFDIDDTLVDLKSANIATAREASLPFLRGADEADVDAVSTYFWTDPEDKYDAYLRGELTFAGQRVARVRSALRQIGVELSDADAQEWNEGFERIGPRYWKLFPDVLELLDALEDAGIPYGALTNNVVDYQRHKLDVCGLQRISVLIGTDTVGAVKPDPAIFHEGVRQLELNTPGLKPAEVLYVGDNLVADAHGALGAGLQSVWLNRHADLDRDHQQAGEGRIAGLDARSLVDWNGAVISGLAQVKDYLS